MRIQEMKSGLSHLKKRAVGEQHEDFFEMRVASEAIVEKDFVLPVLAGCELDEPRWSVISFDKREAGALTYNDAASLMSELDAYGVAGLCVVTDYAASQLKG